MDKVFKENPGLEKYFKTSDGSCFYTENSAKNHAKSLDNKLVVLVEKSANTTTNETPAVEEFHTEPTAVEVAEETETKPKKNKK